MNSCKKLALVLAAVLSAGLSQARAQVSLRGVYTASITSTLTAAIAVHNDNSLDAFLFDTSQQEVGRGTTTIDSTGAFALTDVIGYGMTGTLTATGASAQIAGQVTSASWSQPVAYTAPRTAFFGANNSGGSIINGIFTGKCTPPNSGAQYYFAVIVDVNNNLYVIHRYADGTYGGGTGTVTPNGSDTGGTFTYASVKGLQGTGTFTTNAYTMSGTFTDSDGTYNFVAFRDAAANRFGNISTRGFVGTGQNILIGGFVIEGGPKLVLIRVLGPGLANYGVTSPLPDPTLTLYHGTTVIQANTGWQNQPNATLVSEIEATHLAPPDAGDDAILVQLEAGAYTTEVVGASGDTGTALVEIYEVLLD